MFPEPIAMHIPDGFLSVQVSIVLWVVAILVVGYSLRRVADNLGERQVPLMGVLAAAIFAGQMLNFAVGGGTSGHLLGAAIATILLGPWEAVLVLTCVITVQAIIFQDGGLVVLGANIFNMAIVAVMVAYTTFRTVHQLAGERKWGLFAAGFLAAWMSVVISALATALELSLSGTSPANLAIPAMGGIHALIGIGEGLITLGALALISASRSNLLKANASGEKRGKLVWVTGLILILLLAVTSPLASTHPDGLMWVANRYGFSISQHNPLLSLIPHYHLPGIRDKALATVLAAILGALIVFAVMAGTAYLQHQKALAHHRDKDEELLPRH
jgi:cobalt/nickel transport system permease protein